MRTVTQRVTANLRVTATLTRIDRPFSTRRAFFFVRVRQLSGGVQSELNMLVSPDRLSKSCRGTWLIRNSAPLEPYSRTMPRTALDPVMVLGGSAGSYERGTPVGYSILLFRCRAKSAHTRKARPDSGLVLWVKVLGTFQAVPSLLDSISSLLWTPSVSLPKRGNRTAIPCVLRYTSVIVCRETTSANPSDVISSMQVLSFRQVCITEGGVEELVGD